MKLKNDMTAKNLLLLEETLKYIDLYSGLAETISLADVLADEYVKLDCGYCQGCNTGFIVPDEFVEGLNEAKNL